MKRSVLFAISILLVSCASYQAINTSAFQIGMTKGEAYTATDNRAKLIGAKQYEEGKVEVLSVKRLDIGDSSVAEEYWLYFYNNRLEQWGRPGDWKKQADRIYEVRVR